MAIGLYKSKAISLSLFAHCLSKREVCRKEIFPSEKMMTGDVVLKNCNWVACGLVSAKSHL